MRALLLPVRDDWYAVTLGRVREVVEPEHVTPVPLAPGAVLGVINVRGQVVPVLDTGALAGVGALGGAAAVAVVDTDRGPAGLAASATPVVDVLGDDLGASDLPTADGRRRCGARVVTVLDLDATCAAARIGGGG